MTGAVGIGFNDRECPDVAIFSEALVPTLKSLKLQEWRVMPGYKERTARLSFRERTGSLSQEFRSVSLT